MLAVWQRSCKGQRGCVPASCCGTLRDAPVTKIRAMSTLQLPFWGFVQGSVASLSLCSWKLSCYVPWLVPWAG